MFPLKFYFLRNFRHDVRKWLEHRNKKDPNNFIRYPILVCIISGWEKASQLLVSDVTYILYDMMMRICFYDEHAFCVRTCANSPCMAIDRSTELKLLAEYSLSELFSRLPFRNGPLPRLMRFCDKCSPHKFEPPCVYGMFSNAIPCKCGPLAKSNETPSHWPS